MPRLLQMIDLLIETKMYLPLQNNNIVTVMAAHPSFEDAHMSFIKLTTKQETSANEVAGLRNNT